MTTLVHRCLTRLLAALFVLVAIGSRTVGDDDPADRNPVDARLEAYFAEHDVASGDTVSDRIFIRRATLDIVGLLPTAADVAAFEADNSPDKHAHLIDDLLSRRRDYAEHWLSFWNDALRNEYRGTGYIDGGRAQITGWLYRSLYENKPYDQFVRELINPVPGSEGFTKGIVWRGVVNASQVPPMQAAQNIAQVFLGTNLKCASCHDSFVNKWKLSDAYRLAAVFAAEPLELHFCDKPIGETAQPGFIYPELGEIKADASREERMAHLADIMASPDNKRLARTIVNRLWARFMGRGIIEPLDDMDQEPWNAELLDALADDFISHGFDVKHTIARICKSQAYQMPAIDADPANFEVFRGPLVKRMAAEQFVDAVAVLGGRGPTVEPQILKPDGRGQGGQLAAVRDVLDIDVETSETEESNGEEPSDVEEIEIRASLAFANPLMVALGRPLREQVVTRRDSLATTLEALELTNGETLDQMLRTAAEHWLKREGTTPGSLVTEIYQTAFGRAPTDEERAAATELISPEPTTESLADLLWIIVLQPEFQLIY